MWTGSSWAARTTSPANCTIRRARRSTFRACCKACLLYTSYQRRAKLVANAEVYRGCAIAVSPDRDAPDIQVTAAQAADELLGIIGVQASFLVFEMNGGVSISARSMGQLNVQIIMEKLGGGGHLTMAGAQLSGMPLDEAYRRLVAAIDQYFEENSRN